MPFPTGKRKILIIDPEAGASAQLQRYIFLSGYEAIFAGSAKEGLRKLEGLTPDLVFLAVNQHDDDGLAVLRILHEKHEQLRVIMLAGSADIPKANQALNCGAGDYITKPVDLPTLKRILQIHLPKA